MATLYDRDIDFFISPHSINFFKRFEINSDFLKIDLSLWSQNVNFNVGLDLVKNLRVVNDNAERAIKLVEEYNDKLTKKEDQKQFLLQIIEEYKRNVPDSRKATVLNDYSIND